MPIRLTPLEPWIAAKIGAAGERLSRDALEAHQLRRLQETIDWACRRSAHYRALLAPAGSPPTLAALSELRRLPFTTPDDLRERGAQLLCVSQDEIARVVTLSSSGTTGRPKRLHFTEGEQEAILEFFQHGMSTLVAPGDRTLILLPGETSGSVGALLAAALGRMGVTPIPHGFVRDLPAAVEVMRREAPTSLVGLPVPTLALLRHAEEVAGVSLRLKSALMTTDHVPESIVRELARGFGCQVFQHYGMTETGLGGAVDCEAHDGYHPREAELFFEIVDPGTGEPVPDGVRGEVVVTTLTRRGMPLIRYRTGDLSRLLAGPCRCGSALRRLERIRGRRTDLAVPCGEGERGVTLPELDEVLFQVPGLADFTAQVSAASRPARLAVTALSARPDHGRLARPVKDALDRLSRLSRARLACALAIDVATGALGERLAHGPAKRTIGLIGGDA